MTPFKKSERTTVHRLPKQANYDKELIHRIIDETPVCHVGFECEGSPVIIPCLHGRRGDMLYFHGSGNSRLMQTLLSGARVCLTFTIYRGLVLARAAFAHSAHYECVIGYGSGEEVTGSESKLRAIEAISERMVPGRWKEVRPASDAELAATCVVGLILEEASAKVSDKGPGDREKDLEWPVWAGVVPFKSGYTSPQQDPNQAPMDLPDHVSDILEKRG